ncbi:MAG: 30S ribosomal protein S6 [Patescibacteria group bacterium]
MAETSQPEEGFTQANDASSEGAAKTPVYEIGFHVVPTVGDEGVSAVVEKIHAALGDAEIIKEQFPAKMMLAYVIERAAEGKREKYAEAYFGWIKFAMERDAIPAFEDVLRGMRDVLRFLLIETVREDIVSPRRAIFTSDRLEGQTLKKPTAAPEAPAAVSEEELDKSIEALVQ